MSFSRNSRHDLSDSRQRLHYETGNLRIVASVTAAATMAVVADFNSDGHPDWVARNVNTRQTVLLYLNDNVVIGAALGPTLISNLGLTGAADFNVDTHPDYALFAPNTFQTTLWYLFGPTLIGTASGPLCPPAGSW